MVDARTPRNRNSLRTQHVDEHHLFARVKLRRELAALFMDKVAMVSCDDMNKIKVGTKAVSRFHRIRTFFGSDDQPNSMDHDFPIPGYHLVTSGYMQLQFQREEEVVRDELGRLHYATPRSGPTDLVLRACKFQKSSIQGHANDLTRILKPQIEAGKSAVFLVVDNGPDWNLASLKTFIMYGRLWRDLDLDILCATSYLAGYSAFNDIEHLWAVVTKRLGAVTLSAVHGDDPKPPHYMAGISAEERSEKEVAVFDGAMSEVKSYWDGMMFNGFPVSTQIIPCKGAGEGCYNDIEHLESFLKAPLRSLIRGDSEFTPIMLELRMLVQHADRRFNEVNFSKCTDGSCWHYSAKPVKAKGLMSFIRNRNGTLFEAKASPDHPGHFLTFMEMAELGADDLPKPNEGLPSAMVAGLGKCSICPSYCYTSKTEKARHVRVLHRQKTNARKQGSHICKFVGCDLSFLTAHLLSLHKHAMGHFVRKRRVRDVPEDGQQSDDCTASSDATSASELPNDHEEPEWESSAYTTDGDNDDEGHFQGDSDASGDVDQLDLDK